MTRRLLNLLTALSLLLGVASLALWVVSYVAGEKTGRLRPSNAHVQGGLATPLPPRFNDPGPFVKIVTFLEGNGGVPVVVNWPALGEVGVNPHARVQLPPGNPRVGEALAAVLNVGDRAVFVTRGDGVYITTRAELVAHVQAGPEVMTRSLAPPPDPRLREAVLAGQRWTVAADRGVLKVWWNPADPAAAYQPPRAAVAPSAGSSVALGDFMVGHFGYPLYSWRASVPFWAIALTVGVVPLARLAGRVRRRRARRAGLLCGNYGYDLRATPERCPECGAVGRPASAA
jgi:hypothetical protein